MSDPPGVRTLPIALLLLTACGSNPIASTPQPSASPTAAASAPESPSPSSSAVTRAPGAVGKRLFALPVVGSEKPNSVVVSIDLPAATRGSKSHYFKVTDRETWTHAVVSAAVVLQMDGDVCRSARVVLGGVAPIPWRLPNVEQLLAGQRVTDELARRAAEASVSGARALSKNAYKLPMTRGVVRRALLHAAQRA